VLLVATQAPLEVTAGQILTFVQLWVHGRALRASRIEARRRRCSDGGAAARRAGDVGAHSRALARVHVHRHAVQAVLELLDEPRALLDGVHRLLRALAAAVEDVARLDQLLTHLHVQQWRPAEQP
jgi:hypothetical protein